MRSSLSIDIRYDNRLWRRGHGGFTLVEVLVVLFIMMLLTAVALPTVRNVLLDQKNARAARSIVSFIDIARSRAIAEGREVGILVERLNEDISDPVGASASIRIRQLTGVPTYSGESADVRARLANETGAVPGIDTAIFDAGDNPLLAISARLAGVADTAPIRPGVDRIELPGGKIVTILATDPADPNRNGLFLSTDGLTVRARFDPRDRNTSVLPVGIQGPTYEFPTGNRRQLTPGQQVKFRVHRSPIRSSTAPLSLPRGVAVDLNYSGIGLSNNGFAPSAGAVNSIAIVFGPDGRVSQVQTAAGGLVVPHSQIYLCLGDLAGVRPDDYFASQGRDRANLFRNKSSWIVINNQTGRATVSPFASVSAATLADPDLTPAQRMSQALRESRQLASLSDSLDAN